MSGDDHAVRGLTGDNEYATSIEADVTALRSCLHAARVAMENADVAAMRLRIAGQGLAITQGFEFTADLVALIEDVQRDARALFNEHRRRSLHVAETGTFVLDELRRIRRA